MAVIKDLIIGADGLASVLVTVAGGVASVRCAAQDAEVAIAAIRESVEQLEPVDQYFSEGSLHAMPIQPSPVYVFNWASKQWEDPRTLGELQDAKWEVIKLDRASHETGTFQWNGHTVDADKERINGAATGVLIAKAASVEYADVWTLADNSTIPVTGDDILAMGVALVQHVSACHARGRALRQLIYSCTTKEEVEAITWETAV